MNKKKVLGKGLEALIPLDEELSTGVRMVGIEELKPNPFQPRINFKDDKLNELALSIKEKGILQPLIVRNSHGGYQIVAGERRWRAAQKASVKEVPVVIREFSDIECLEVALIENLQREDLSPLEESRGYQKLLSEFNITQEELSKRVGKDRATIANSVRLLKLPDKVLDALEKKLISVGHARALLSIEDKASIVDACNTVIQKHLSVRETETFINRIKSGKKKGVRKRGADIPLSHLEERFIQALGTKVKIVGSRKKGKVEIFYFSQDELERIKEILVEGY